MKAELLILGVTGFLIYNTYHDGKYLKNIMAYKKYYQIAFFGILGISVYLLMKKNPAQCKTMLMSASNVVKYMPIDRTAIDMFSPIIDFTSSNSNDDILNFSSNHDREERILMNSGKTGTKRSVSETKKKYVASLQSWKCGHCKKELNAWFEVDHKMSLENGGNNEVANLVALCRDCHGRKTAMENM